MFGIHVNKNNYIEICYVNSTFWSSDYLLKIEDKSWYFLESKNKLKLSDRTKANSKIFLLKTVLHFHKFFPSIDKPISWLIHSGKMIEYDIFKVNQSSLLEKPFLIILTMEIPLNNPGAVFMRIFAYIQRLPTEGKDDKFSTSRRHLLKSEPLIPPMR